MYRKRQAKGYLRITQIPVFVAPCFSIKPFLRRNEISRSMVRCAIFSARARDLAVCFSFSSSARRMTDWRSVSDSLSSTETALFCPPFLSPFLSPSWRRILEHNPVCEYPDGGVSRTEIVSMRTKIHQCLPESIQAALIVWCDTVRPCSIGIVCIYAQSLEYDIVAFPDVIQLRHTIGVTN